MMRLACIEATETGIELVAPVHDALVAVAPLEHLDEHVAHLKSIMQQASKAVLDGFEIFVDVKVFRYPDRYVPDDRGVKMWARVQELLAKHREKAA
jgi:DNA polymerase-1